MAHRLDVCLIYYARFMTEDLASNLDQELIEEKFQDRFLFAFLFEVFIKAKNLLK